MTQDAWGPRDWAANGIGGESFTALPADPADEPGEPGFEESGFGEPGFEESKFDEPDFDEPAFAAPKSARSKSAWSKSAEPAFGARRGADRAAARPEPETDPAVRARNICLRLLTGSAKTRGQLAEALRKREIPAEVIEEVLSRYEEVGLIDDAAFAESWVESRHRGRGLSRRALANELRTKGVDSAVAAEAVARLDPEQEAATARALVDRKLRSTAGLDRQVRIRRLAGMLARRGYPEGLALRVVRQALDDEQLDAGDGP